MAIRTVADRHLGRGSDSSEEEDRYITDVPRLCADDHRRGQSLVVWAIKVSRGATRAIDQFLLGDSELLK